MADSSLIKKYDVPGPRYTSYPTVPHWQNETFSSEKWTAKLVDTFVETNHTSGISLYIHLPYCESLCTFCACHKRITKNHAVEQPYIQAVLKEWALYLALFPEKPRVAEIHLGGGTPSFFAPEMLQLLIAGILENVEVTPEHEFSFEGHPNNTTAEHLQVLYDLGFRRVSFGVQDYDPQVQKAIHRIQPFENVKKVTELARAIGYTSVSHDLVFGLPFQKISSVEDTIQKTLTLKPDRIAFYSYAHVPWIKGNGQRGFEDENLPSGEEKRALYERGRAMFEQNNYAEIGMDHFALPQDNLYKAQENGTLHRNFMGYTTTQSQVLLGLGASSISDSWTAFTQNIKEIDVYIDTVNAGELPVFKGHILSNVDVFIRQQILNIICQLTTTWQLSDWSEQEKMVLFEKLEGFEADGLITFNEFGLNVLPAGKAFIRNICMAFDKHLNQADSLQKLFSKTI
ncbi:Oxygen-independent coproporphyrinogen III oxidase [Emticicia aquatica]|uniref:Coproporphyrinogen-III oxidase n=1 Tax=Emticicia aquatica TaxID=1681835 RepID=A0ABM9AW91_9BACT|nr:oxygen-independent coproporphyrinogen III oxidase [Emticicia aquatica]CAH0997863.1 Oxygen-independent coproporphyrinogen III oxidase [Emticicia aquatica]